MKVTRDRSSPYPSLVDALRLLPNIRPVCERHRLGEAKHHASLSPDRTASVNGVSVTLLELEELFLDSERGSPRVSQAGAALLLRLFEQGAFDFSECRPVEGGAGTVDSVFQRPGYAHRAEVLGKRSSATAPRASEESRAKKSPRPRGFDCTPSC